MDKGPGWTQAAACCPWRARSRRSPCAARAARPCRTRPRRLPEGLRPGGGARILNLLSTFFFQEPSIIVQGGDIQSYNQGGFFQAAQGVWGVSGTRLCPRGPPVFGPLGHWLRTEQAATVPGRMQLWAPGRTSGACTPTRRRCTGTRTTRRSRRCMQRWSVGTRSCVSFRMDELQQRPSE